MVRWHWSFIVVCLTSVLWLSPSPTFAQNTIRKDTFNFAHQLGYMYAEPTSAVIRKNWMQFQTGILAYYTASMPLVTNINWQRYTLVRVPIELQVDFAGWVGITLRSDPIAQLPTLDSNSYNVNSPRLETRIRILQGTRRRPAVAIAVGTKFSSSKPWTIWADKHNYATSNGLSGPGTGVADYWINLAGSYLWKQSLFHINVGLAPLGDPTANLDAGRSPNLQGGSQADQVLFRAAYFWNSTHWKLGTQIVGMVGAISTTTLDEYVMSRSTVSYRWKAKRGISHAIVIRGEVGLTDSSDDIAGGLLYRYSFRYGR